jgi:hypothetical protein
LPWSRLWHRVAPSTAEPARGGILPGRGPGAKVCRERQGFCLRER